MAHFTEGALERLRDLVQAQPLPPTIQPSPFLDNLIARQLRRYPPLLDVEPVDDAPAAVEPEELAGGLDDAVAFVLAQLTQASQSPYFALVQQVAVSGDDQALEQLMVLLDRHLKLRGILFRHGLDPDSEYPALWGKVWEAIPKWDGRDFRAYVARIVRNHCLDEIARKKRRPAPIDEIEPGDPRPSGHTADVASSRDAVDMVMAVLDELEADGRIKALDGVMFALVSQGRTVADIVTGFRTTGLPERFRGAVGALGHRTSASDAILLRLLLDGLTADEAAAVTARDSDEVATVADALGDLTALDDEEALLAKALAREGLGVKDLERAARLTTNAVNLCLNRIRLKIWMAVVDRGYEALRRRKAVTPAELALVQHRCLHAPPAGCRMYKDETCKRQRDLVEIARAGGIDEEPEGMLGLIRELRRKVLEDGLGMVFPDYAACLIERKPLRS